MGLLAALFLIFITLKLVGVIDWGWLWVVSPLWVDIFLSVLISWLKTALDKYNKNYL